MTGDTHQDSRIRVALLFGGRSSEHDISLLSARAVLNHLDPNRYDIVPVAIDREGVWHAQDHAALMTEAAQQRPALPVTASDHRATLSAQAGAGLSRLGPVDVVLPIMHGPLYEDGAVQGLCELADVAYVGCGVLSSAVCMDKDVAKRLVMAAGVGTAAYALVRAGQWPQAAFRSELLADVNDRLGYPVFVKPANMGSSVGVSRAGNASELEAAVADALQYDTKVLIEEAISAREIELAVLGASAPGTPPDVSLPGEIEAAEAFYSYERKYIDAEGAKLHVPADLSPEQTAAAQDVARRCFVALECEGLARIDLFLEGASGRFLFNESNTMPGFTNISMFAKMWAASGLAYGPLLDRLIDDALARHRTRSGLKRTR